MVFTGTRPNKAEPAAALSPPLSCPALPSPLSLSPLLCLGGGPYLAGQRAQYISGVCRGRDRRAAAAAQLCLPVHFAAAGRVTPGQIRLRGSRDSDWRTPRPLWPISADHQMPVQIVISEQPVNAGDKLEGGTAGRHREVAMTG